MTMYLHIHDKGTERVVPIRTKNTPRVRTTDEAEKPWAQVASKRLRWHGPRLKLRA